MDTTTYGGMTFDALGMLNDVLAQKRCSLHYANKLKMPGNYIVMYQAHPQQKIGHQLDEAIHTVDRIADEIF